MPKVKIIDLPKADSGPKYYNGGAVSLDAIIKQNREDRDNNSYSGGISKYATGGVTNDPPLGGKEFIDNWIKSPMYDKMLRASAKGKEYEAIKQGRETNFAQPIDIERVGPLGLYQEGQPEQATVLGALKPRLEQMPSVEEFEKAKGDKNAILKLQQQILYPKTTGYSINMLNSDDFDPNSSEYQEVLAHEAGHREDTPWNLRNWFINNDDLRGKKILYTPKSDIELLKNSIDFSKHKFPKGFAEYINREGFGEVRGIINEGRYLGKAKGIYDPYNEEISQDQFDKLLNIRKGEDNPAKRLLNIVGGDKEKARLLINSISKSNTSQPQTMAKNGGVASNKGYYNVGMGIPYIGNERYGGNVFQSEAKVRMDEGGEPNLDNLTKLGPGPQNPGFPQLQGMVKQPGMYNAMQPFYDELFKSAAKYSDDAGNISGFNRLRASIKATLKHPEVIFMKRHDLPLDVQLQNPYHEPSFHYKQGNVIRTSYPSQYAMSSRQPSSNDDSSPLKDWWQEHIGQPLQNWNEERKINRDIRRQGSCWDGNCYEDGGDTTCPKGQIWDEKTQKCIPILPPIYTFNPNTPQKQNPNVPKGWIPLTPELAKGRYSGNLKDMYYNPTGSTTGDSAISYFAPPKVDKPEPTLKKKVLNVEPIQSSLNTINPQLRTIEHPNVELPSKINMGHYKVDYFDPTESNGVQGGWHTKSFMTDQDAGDYMKNRPLYGPSMTQRVEYKNGGENYCYDTNGNVIPCAGQTFNTTDSLRHLAGQTMDYEARKGSPTGGGLSDWGYHSSQLPYNKVSANWHAPQTKQAAVDTYMDEVGNNPILGYFPTAMEKGEAGDFLYNTGRDARVYMLDQYLKSIGQSGLPNRGSYNVDTKTDKWTPQLQSSLDQIWNQYSGEINKLPVNQRRILLNKGRDFYYQNINQVNGKPNPSYEATWKPRIWESVNTYKADGGDISIPNLSSELLQYYNGKIQKFAPGGLTGPGPGDGSTVLSDKKVGEIRTPLQTVNLRPIYPSNTYKVETVTDPNCPDPSGLGCSYQATRNAQKITGLPLVEYAPANAAYRDAVAKRTGLINVFDQEGNQRTSADSDASNWKYPTKDDFSKWRAGDIVTLDAGTDIYFPYNAPPGFTEKDNDNVTHNGVIVGFTSEGRPIIKHGHATKKSEGEAYTEVLGDDNRVTSLGHGRYAIKSVWRPKGVTETGGIENVKDVIESAQERATRKSETYQPAKFSLGLTSEEKFKNQLPVAAAFSNANTRLDTKNNLVNLFNDKSLDKELQYQLGITAQDLQNLKPVIFGIAGQESNFNNPNILGSLKDVPGNLSNTSNSKGLFQIKFDSLTDQEKKVLGIKSPNDLLNDKTAYKAAILLMNNAKNRMDSEVEQGTHPQLKNADPYFRAAYYYNSPARAISTSKEWAQGTNPVSWYNPTTWFNPLPFMSRGSIDDTQYLNNIELRMDKGSYPYKLMEKAKDLNMENPSIGDDASEISTMEPLVIRSLKKGSKSKFVNK